MTQGVLGAGYARERAGPGEVRFRLRVRARAAADAILAGLGPGPHRILDMGSAEGRGLAELSRLLPGSVLCGVEASPELVGAAPPLPHSVSLVLGTVTALPTDFASGSVDAVTALALLEHLPDPGAAVREAARVLRPGGLLLATCPRGVWDRIATTLGLLDDEQHEHELDRIRLEELARDAGLEVVGFRRFMWAPVGALAYFRVPVSARFALAVDRSVSRVRVLDGLFVNQLLVARRPSDGGPGAQPAP